MAKLRGKAKQAFLRRMARGRAKSRRVAGVARHSSTVARRRRTRRSVGYSGYVMRSRKRPGVVRFRVRRNPLAALIANPGYTPAYAAGWERTFGTRKRKRRKAAKTMARRKKRRSGKRRARRAAPRRRSYRRRPRRSYRRRHGRRGGIARVRRGTRVIYINPRKKRRRSYRRRRNPGGMGGLLKRAFVPYITGVVTAGAAAMLDAGLAKWPIVRQVAKVAGVVGIATFFGRKHPNASAAAIGALGASQGYPLVTQLAGGLVARTPAEAVKGLGAMTETYPEMGALLQGGLGALLQGPSDVEDATGDYTNALVNMADDDEDD